MDTDTVVKIAVGGLTGGAGVMLAAAKLWSVRSGSGRPRDLNGNGSGRLLRCEGPEAVERLQREEDRRQDRLALALDQLAAKLGELGLTLKLGQQEVASRSQSTAEVLGRLVDRLDHLADQQRKTEAALAQQARFLELERVTGGCNPVPPPSWPGRKAGGDR